MNFLLYLPGLCYLLWTSLGPVPSLLPLALIALPQLALAAPFLASPASALTYAHTAFDFSRAFLWEWTVNWRWLGEDAFHKRELAGGLVLGHLVGLVLLALSWGEVEGGLVEVVWRGVRRPTRPAGRGRPSADREWRGRSGSVAVGGLGRRGLIGGPWLVGCRDLHDPVHVQRAGHRVRPLAALPVLRLVRAPDRVPALAVPVRTLPPVSRPAAPLSLAYLGVSQAKIHRLTDNDLRSAGMCRAAILGGIEWGWNVFPSTERSSLTVTLANLALVVAAVTGGNGGGFSAVAPEGGKAAEEKKEKRV